MTNFATAGLGEVSSREALAIQTAIIAVFIVAAAEVVWLFVWPVAKKWFQNKRK